MRPCVAHCVFASPIMVTLKRLFSIERPIIESLLTSSRSLGRMFKQYLYFVRSRGLFVFFNVFSFITSCSLASTRALRTVDVRQWLPICLRQTLVCRHSKVFCRANKTSWNSFKTFISWIVCIWRHLKQTASPVPCRLTDPKPFYIYFFFNTFFLSCFFYHCFAFASTPLFMTRTVPWRNRHKLLFPLFYSIVSPAQKKEFWNILSQRRR